MELVNTKTCSLFELNDIYFIIEVILLLYYSKHPF